MGLTLTQDTKLTTGALTVGALEVGTLFQATNGAYYLKVEPTKTLHNSKMVREVIDRGDCFVVGLVTGILTVVPGWSVVKARYLQANVELGQASL